MGIFGALTTAVSGLRAQAFALERISDNIANSQTTGYKRSDASFADFVPDSPARQQALGVVNAFSRTTNTIQGDVSNSEVDTHIAINGDGYFIISQQADTVDGLPVFSSETLYTRRGDFEFDRNGYLVNATGYFLQGLPIDPTTGNPSGSSPTVIRISNDFLPAITTTEINYRANLAEFPLTASSDPTVPGSELIVPGDYAVNPLNAGAGTGVVQANDVNIFINQTISGGAITAFDQAGASVNVQLRWAKTDNVTDTWNLFYLTDSAATGTDTAWQNIGQEYIFGANSQLNPPIVSTTITALTVNGVNLGDVTLDHGSNGITQFADPNGVVKVTQISQNGSSAGQLVGTTISNEGRVVA
ncbi:MAG: flagellar hook-basal body complex protein, partial [Proteobacteria bacterium]|nr:flagellar hook-basal body complex protein [Pseudomonadota bacterium]